MEKEGLCSNGEYMVDEALLMRYISNEVSETEKKEIEGWLEKDKANWKTLSDIAIICDVGRSRIKMRKRDLNSSYEKVLRNINRRKIAPIIRWSLEIAAAITICVTFALFNSRGEQVIIPVQTVTVNTNPGMRTTIDLPDGTKVTLNSSSTLSYSVPFDENNRTVNLEGEGYFDVFTDKEKPFVVQLRDSSVQVIATGTEFSIQAYPNDYFISTTLVEGAVDFVSKKEDGSEQILSMNPSERILYNDTYRKTQVTSVNTEYYTSWTEGKMIFNETPILEVLNRLSHFYDIKIEVANKEILGYCFTGTFENRQLTQVLDYLKISSGIQYTVVRTVEDDLTGIQRDKVILK